MLYSRHYFHVTYKLYMVSMLFELVGLFFLCVHYGVYSEDGVGVEPLKTLGRAAEAVSTLIFLLLLILLGKGFTVTRARLKPSTAAKIGIFMTFYTVIYACLFCWEQYVSLQASCNPPTHHLYFSAVL